MAHFSIIRFDRVGFRFSFRDFIAAEVIPEQVVEVKAITEIPFGFRGLVHHSLERFLSALPNHFPAQNAARISIYERDDVDPVFLSPMKVNNSSISAVLTCSGTGASGNRSA